MKLTELPCGSLITTFILAVIFYIDSTVRPEEEDGIPGYFSCLRLVEIPTVLHCNVFVLIHVLNLVDWFILHQLVTVTYTCTN